MLAIEGAVYAAWYPVLLRSTTAYNTLTSEKEASQPTELEAQCFLQSKCTVKYDPPLFV